MPKNNQAPAQERVKIVWPKSGAVATPLVKDLQAWLDQGWKRQGPVTPTSDEASTKETEK
jgi:hypothetical protein